MAAPVLVQAFDAGQGQLPESVTTDDDGNFYMSMGSTVTKRTPNGQLSVLATPPIPEGAFVTGVKFGPDGFLYAGSGGFAPEPSAAFVWRIDPDDGSIEEFAALDPLGFPNDLAFNDDGDLFVTDPFLGQIWKIDEDGDADVWIQHPTLEGTPDTPVLLIHDFGVDGIAFDKHQENLYIGNLDKGTIVRIPVQCGGHAGQPKIYAEDDRLAGADGIAFDHDGNLYVAVNWQDSIAMVDKKGKVSTVATGGVLDGPSSLVFGTSPQTKKTLYISSFAINRALGTQPGAPMPSLSKMSVKTKGLELY
ncbi:MAG: SMP-30/gluconolactonase/LRE family protein [Nannocystaceae bacterium]